MIGCGDQGGLRWDPVWERIFCGGWWCEVGCTVSVGKRIFIENDMSGDDNFTSVEIKTPVPFVFPWIAKKNTACGTWREFMVNRV